jgi:hypothetical protein
MFEFWYLPSIINAIDKVPKEVAIGVAAYFTLTELHKRHTQVKIEEVRAKTQVANLEVEALKLKLKLQENEPHIKPVS